MKILVAGNLANHGYQHVKLLRKHGIDAHLLAKKNSKLEEDPKFFDNELIEYPKWIRFWDSTKWNWKFRIISIMREYEVIHASTEFPIFALFTGRPYVAATTGSDIVELAQSNTIKGRLLKTAYRRARILIYLAPYMHYSVEKLKIRNAIFLPVLWDYSQFYPDIDLTEHKTLTIFHPTNHIWDVKRNDMFLKAFVRVTKERDDVHLITINRGKDFIRSMEILDTPHNKDKFTVLPKSIIQKELPKIYNKVDVVADQFASGSTGLIGQEAMACGKPLIQFADKDLYNRFYDESPPIVSGNTEQEIYDSIIRLANDRELVKNIGKQSREWLVKHHNHDKIIKKYIYVYKSIKERIDFQIIKNTLPSIE